jgi:hypothetical protein
LKHFYFIQNQPGARPSRLLCGASRAAFSGKDVSGGTPNTARATHALPVHIDTFQPKNEVKNQLATSVTLAALWLTQSRLLADTGKIHGSSKPKAFGILPR